MNIINTKQQSWQEKGHPSIWGESTWQHRHDSVNMILFRLILVGICFFSAITGHLVFALCGLPAYFAAMRVYTILPHKKGPLVAFLCGASAGLVGGAIGFLFYNLFVHPTIGVATFAMFATSLILISYMVIDKK